MFLDSWHFKTVSALRSLRADKLINENLDENNENR